MLQDRNSRTHFSRHQTPGIDVFFQPVQILAQFSSSLVTVWTLLRERFVDDGFQLGWNLWIQLAWRYQRPVKNRIMNHCGGFSGEGRLSRGHLVEHGTEGKYIGANVQLLA